MHIKKNTFIGKNWSNFFNFFRELINILRQTCFICLLLIFPENKDLLKYIIILVLIYSIILSSTYVPRIRRIFNLLENISFLSCFFLACLSYLVTEDFPFLIKLIIASIFVFLHAAFYIIIGYKLIKEFLLRYSKKFKKIFKSLQTITRKKKILRKGLRFDK